MEKRLEFEEKCLLVLNDKATDKTKEEFFKEMEQDPKLKEVFEEVKLLHKGFKLLDQHRKAKALFASPKKNYLGIASLAATVLFLTFFSFLAWNKNYFPKILPKTSVLMSAEITELEDKESEQRKAYDLFMKGQSYFEAQEYELALNCFKESSNVPNLRNHLQEAILWYTCVTYLHLDRANEARSMYEVLENLENPKFKVSQLSKWKIEVQIFLKSVF